MPAECHLASRRGGNERRGIWKFAPFLWAAREKEDGWHIALSFNARIKKVFAQPNGMKTAVTWRLLKTPTHAGCKKIINLNRTRGVRCPSGVIQLKYRRFLHAAAAKMQVLLVWYSARVIKKK
jgi:hypothetical protein